MPAALAPKGAAASNTTISLTRWRCGRGFPRPALLPRALRNILVFTQLFVAGSLDQFGLSRAALGNRVFRMINNGEYREFFRVFQEFFIAETLHFYYCRKAFEII
ncbi:hypothetical protein [Paraburkholderia sediminicola]|uniref:hypothetical protein n=1 Tax=Paraburkholderia sediminicola TaxID=458836 RepID=UPI001FE3DCB6|nr:hypothetical protein [Paraburkholderia sediminicola]